MTVDFKAWLPTVPTQATINNTDIIPLVPAGGVTTTITGSILKGLFPAGANPSATVGLSAVNGTAATFITSDSAPALSQAIAPTWTGKHTFSPAVRSSGSSPYFVVNAPADTT